MGLFDIAFPAQEESTIFTCGLLLPSDQEEAAISLNKQIAANNPHKIKFIFNRDTHPPYVRLYETVLPNRNVSSAVNTLKNEAKKTHPFAMKWSTIERTDHFVAIWGETNDELESFHKSILDKINTLREGYFKEKYLEDEAEHAFSNQEEASFRKWGSPWAEPYHPHMIIAKAEPTFDVKKVNLFWDYPRCTFSGVIGGTRDQHGNFISFKRIAFSKSG